MNCFDELMVTITALNGSTFDAGASALIDWVESLTFNQFQSLTKQIGVIPESIAHDSTAEKLFSKATDIVLARGFREIGLKSEVLQARGDSADVQAESKYHGYSLVADSKAFRLSRTAKNQKDYKVVALSGWRQDADYAVLCAPYFQYPNANSQIFKQALDNNVLIFSWEQLLTMLKYGIKETANNSLSEIWNWSESKAVRTTVASSKECFLEDELSEFFQMIDLTEEQAMEVFEEQIKLLKSRGAKEIKFWRDAISEIEAYSRDKAIKELIREKKIESKIQTIENFTRRLEI